MYPGAGNDAVTDGPPVISVIDDEASVRKALVRVLRTAGYQAEVYGSAEEFLDRSPSNGPGCLILDVMLPGVSGIALQKRLAEQGYCPPIIFLSGHSDIPTSVQALKGGAVDFLTKPFKNASLLEAVRISLIKDRDARALQKERSDIQQRIDTLSEREREVLPWVVGGSLNKQIAAELGITEATVKAHRARIMSKLSAASLADLVRLTEKAGIVPVTWQGTASTVPRPLK